MPVLDRLPLVEVVWHSGVLDDCLPCPLSTVSYSHCRPSRVSCLLEVSLLVTGRMISYVLCVLSVVWSFVSEKELS